MANARKFYLERLAMFGATARGVGWGCDQTQRTRFEVLTGVGIRPGDRLLDAGCGVGHLAEFLTQVAPVHYVGIDSLKEMIALARARLAHRFEVSKMETWEETADVAIACGPFWDYLSGDKVFEAVQHLFSISKRAVAFTLGSNWKPISPRLGDLAFDPRDAIERCRSLTRWVVLRHDYHLPEMILYLYHRSPWEQSQ